MRHGRPQHSKNNTLNSAGFARWVKNYNQSLVCESSLPTSDFSTSYQDYYLISSDLPRARHSAQIALHKTPNMQSKLLREMEIPRYKIPLRLRAWTWVYVNRSLWTVGVKGPFESYKEAKVRASKAADIVYNKALEHERVIVFAHGYINLHMRKFLRAKGLQQTSKSSKYWGCTGFQG